MIDVGDTVEYGGVNLKLVAWFDQPTVVLENEQGERVTVAAQSLIYNRMTQIGDRNHSVDATKEGE